MVSTRVADVRAQARLKSSLQGTIAAPATKATNGRYEEIAVPERLAPTLAEWGKDLAALHMRQTNQFRVTVQRPNGGDLQSPRIELARPGLTGTISLCRETF
jgi:hypothetical protein